MFVCKPCMHKGKNTSSHLSVPSWSMSDEAATEYGTILVMLKVAVIYNVNFL